jgi:menaquinone-dependent protoporphyrinogen oxidase
VAEAVGEALGADDVSVDIRPADDVRDLSGYRAIVIGTPLQAGHLHQGVYEFVEQHRAALDDIPVAFFAVCLAMKADTPDNRREVEGVLADIWEKYPEVKPVDIGLFGGTVRPGEVARQRLPFARRVRHRNVKVQPGRLSDWDDAASWAARVRDKLTEV